ncbi:hypothetical protein UlMin_031969 [Ulmus minor]
MAQQHQNRSSSSLQDCLSAVQWKFTWSPNARHRGKRSAINGEVMVVQSYGQPGSGKSASVQIYSGTTLDPKTGKGKLSEKANLNYGKSSVRNGEKITTYKIKFQVEQEFGIPGAILIKNKDKHRFFLQSASLNIPNNQTIQFDCNSWVYPVKQTGADRVFFSNTKYLPNQTPKALVELRKDELVTLRGDGRGERKEWDRIYDYDYYNDLGNPGKGLEYMRPVLGGSDSLPYPRRLRTGRSPSNEDPLTESRPDMISLDIFVPPDERFSSKKLSDFISSSAQAAVYCLSHEAKQLFEQESDDYNSFDEVHNMFSGNRSRSQEVEGWIAEKLKNVLPAKLFKEVADVNKKNPQKFPIPQIIAENELAWKNDEEFARQMLAGTNPAHIRSLESFPPESDNGVRSLIQQSDIEHNLDGLSVAEAMHQWKLLILDHHDYLMPFLEIINGNGVCVYASRTLLFLRSDETLKPVAIELSLPDPPNVIGRVFVPENHGEAGALWKFAKAHVAANDSAYHQLVSHWLHTHAVVEPFIIATNRQLSVTHPIHWLLQPHFKDTLHINAMARTILINSGGILEKTLFSAEISMKLSAELYREWRFDEQALPADLLKRGLAFEDEDQDNPTGVQLLFQDYPYAEDGLEIWTAIKTWVTDFCSLFYADDDYVKTDEEIQAWWGEIRNVGHGDKCNETWWYQMTSLSDLIESLTTLIWIASALHASVNFGQYAYAGSPLNRPTQCRRFIPCEGTYDYAEFLEDPDEYYLKMLPGKLETSLNVALVAVLSAHSSDEVYLGQRSSAIWINNEEVRQRFEKFNKELREIEIRIADRNANPMRKNRRGPAGIPYEQLYPDTSKVETNGGITGKGIPNSISI